MRIRGLFVCGSRNNLSLPRQDVAPAEAGAELKVECLVLRAAPAFAGATLEVKDDQPVWFTSNVGKHRLPPFHFCHHRFALVGRAHDFDLLFTFSEQDCCIVGMGGQVGDAL